MEKDRDYHRALSKSELKQAVCKNFGDDDASIVDYQLTAFSEEPLGFLGVHFRVKGQAMVRGKIENFQFFGKKIPEDVPMHFEYATNIGAFFKEVQFYETIVADVKRNLTGKHKKWCPDFLFSRGDHVILCEDLTTTNYYMHPDQKMMELDHVLALMKTLAAMHAAPLLLMAKLKAGTAPNPPPNWSKDHPADLSLLYNHILYETEVTDTLGHPGRTLYLAGMKSQLPVVDLLPGYTQEQRENIKKHLPDILYRLLEFVKPSKKYRNTFTHGDLWSNNMMFSDDENGRVKDAIIIDFQLARFAPPALDITMFIHMVQNRAFRDKHESTILEHYYESFTEEVEREGFSAEDILPKKELLESYKEFYEFGVLQKILLFQYFLTPPHIISKYLDTPEIFERTFFVDRSEMVLEAFHAEEKARVRITEAMREIIDLHHLDDLDKWKDKVPKLQW